MENYKINYNEDDFKGFVQQLIDAGKIEPNEMGIAKRMLDKGYSSLSEKQKYVFDKMIKENTILECKRCAVEIPWCEMYEVINNNGLCSYCQNVLYKTNKK